LKAVAKIKALKSVSGYPKYLKIVDGINAAISDKEFEKGDLLPSVNGLSAELGVARETVVTAYRNLKDRGIISSRQGVGYYIENVDTDQQLRVALVLYAFHSFQEIFYNSFRAALGSKVKIEVFFHHNNPQIYEQIISNIKGKYGMYVVAPIHHIITQKILSDISPNRLLIIDRFEDMGDAYSYIAQEFEQSTFNILKRLESQFKKFDLITLFFKDNSDYPPGIKKAFKRFLKTSKLKGSVKKRYKKSSIQKRNAYITIGDVDLWELLKDAQQLDLKIGKDIGILSSNDSPVKEIICGGITTFFADFDHMAKKAAHFVLNKTHTKEILKVEVFRRKSL